MIPNKGNGDYIVTFFQMSDASETCCTISNNVLVAQPTLAFGKGGDFDIPSTISQQYPVSSIDPRQKKGTTVGNFGAPIISRIQRFNITSCSIFGRNWRSTTPTGPTVRRRAGTRSCSRGLILGRFKIGNDTPTRPINLIVGAGYRWR